MFAELGAKEAPVRVCSQLFITLVVRINWKEKSLWVPNMHHHRNAKLAGLLKDWCKTFVIDVKKLSACITHGQAEIFPELESDGPMLYQTLKPVDAYSNE